jgi:outer membrane protein OmpA-like peptidoglycan-associated protein
VRGWVVLCLVLILPGCATVTDRVVLLQGALVVKAEKGELELKAPFDGAEVKRGKATAVALNPQRLQERYAVVLEAQPSAPRTYLVHFILGKTQLTAQSRVLLEHVKMEVATLPGVDVVVIGHTDRLGSESFNDRLSVLRAQAVRDALVAIGVSVEKIEIAGRGEREPLVPTADGVAEARNRRAEIKVR